MGLFYNNETPGPSIPKKQNKKPFFRFWDLFFNKFGTFFQINLVYFLFCIPIVTIGPATAAMTAMVRNIYFERPQFIFHDFLGLFKKNFKQSFFIGILDVLAVVGAYISVVYFPTLTEADSSMKIAFAMSTAAVILFLLMNFYIYPQIVALDLGLGQIVRNSLILMCANPLGDLIALAVFVGYGTLVFNYPVVMFGLFPFLPASMLAFTAFFCCYPTVQKYIINPYYEKIGEKNPEIPEWMEDDEKPKGNVFKESGGNENSAERKKSNKQSKKVIK